jgi:hypothetical protein
MVSLQTLKGRTNLVEFSADGTLSWPKPVPYSIELPSEEYLTNFTAIPLSDLFGWAGTGPIRPI